MNPQVRKALASVAVGALACSMIASTAQAAGTGDSGSSININAGNYQGRVAGVDRFATAVAASKSLNTTGRKTVLLANASAWSDTLAATPLADQLNTTVLYTWQNSLEEKTVTELKRLKATGVSKVVLVGGTGVISKGVAEALVTLGFSVDRIGGVDRYETALLLALEAVDGYEGKTRIADARAQIRAIEAAEAAYQAALVKWEEARAKTDAAFNDTLVKQAAVAAAQTELNTLVSQIVTVPGAPTQAQLNAAANAVVVARNALTDAQKVEALVNDVLADYAALTGTNFQNDQWWSLNPANPSVIGKLGTKVYTVELSTGTRTGTLFNLSLTVPQLQAAVGAEGTTKTVKEVQVYLAAQVPLKQTALDTANSTLGTLNQAARDAAAATAANEALLLKIAAAQDKLDAAKAALVKSEQAHLAAHQAEEVLRLKVVVLAATRPQGDALSVAQLNLQNQISAALVDAKRYPAFLATGWDFADALTAGPAAAKESGVVLLTDNTAVPASTARYLASKPNVVAVGGPAAVAAPGASVKYVGKDRYETATKLAAAYFEAWDHVGLASGTVAADAVVGGALVANVDSTLVLTAPRELPTKTRQFLSYETAGAQLVIFGGSGAISNAVADEAERAVNKK